MATTAITDVIDQLTIEDVRAELLKTAGRDIVLRSLLRGLLQREHDRQEDARAAAIETANEHR
jgi:hypothetical protein